MKNYRLNRLFDAGSNRCFDVAIDHGVFNERGFLQGIENLEKAVKTVVAAGPDAVQPHDRATRRTGPATGRRVRRGQFVPHPRTTRSHGPEHPEYSAPQTGLR